ncbi:hypothetical protein DFS34DRAFT_634418 [Phlyctochytrium arcticum]|nr:hypothetical protein DFS34DRAFT_634418 [Phlyctochytrium arcticum]
MNFADDAGNLPPKHSIKSTDIKPSASPNRRQDGSYIDLVDFAGKEETLPSDPSASRQLNNALDEKSAAGGGGDLTDTMTIRRSMEGGRNAQSSGSIHAGASTPRRQQSSTTPVEMNRARTTSREHLAGGHGGSLPTNTSTHAGLPRQRPNSPNKNILLQPITTTRPPTIPTSLQSAPLQSYSEQNLEPPAPLLRRPSTYLVRAPSENRYLSSTKHVAGMLEIVGRTRVSMDDAGRHKWKAVLSGNRLPAPSSSQEAFDLEMLVLQIGESCSM